LNFIIAGFVDLQFQYVDQAGPYEMHLDGAYQYMRDRNNSKRRQLKVPTEPTTENCRKRTNVSSGKKTQG
jgi:hypothetical protein